MKIVVLDDYQRVASTLAPWESLDAEVVFVHEHLTGALLVEALRETSVVVAMRERTAFDAALLGELTSLRLLVTTGAVNASIDVAAARGLGVIVCGTRSLASPAAELTWALILAVTRQVALSDAGMRSGGWQTTLGAELAGKTLGLVGLGRLGQRVAKVGLAFEMEVLAWSQHLSPALADSLGVVPTSKVELLARSDVVSLHLRLSDRTRGIIGAAELAQMKPSAYLVNTSRGPLVDEPALIAALESGGIAGAGLDVYDEEPLPADHPLRTTPGTVLTPHLGYVTDGGYRVFYGDVVEDIQAWRTGTPLRELSPTPVEPVETSYVEKQTRPNAEGTR